MDSAASGPPRGESAVERVWRRGANAMVFHKVSKVCMRVMAAASVLQALQPLLRERGRNQSHAERGVRGRWSATSRERVDECDEIIAIDDAIWE